MLVAALEGVGKCPKCYCGNSDKGERIGSACVSCCCTLTVVHLPGQVRRAGREWWWWSSRQALPKQVPRQMLPSSNTSASVECVTQHRHTHTTVQTGTHGHLPSLLPVNGCTAVAHCIGKGADKVLICKDHHACQGSGNGAKKKCLDEHARLRHLHPLVLRLLHQCNNERFKECQATNHNQDGRRETVGAPAQ